MVTGTIMRAAAQQQKLKENLAVILQSLDMQKAELDPLEEYRARQGVSREASPATAAATFSGLGVELQQQNSKVEGQKACYNMIEELQYEKAGWRSPKRKLLVKWEA